MILVSYAKSSYRIRLECETLKAIFGEFRLASLSSPFHRDETSEAMKSLFTDHPASVGETYSQHMGMALSFSLRMLLASLACLVHAVLPFLFVKTGSRAIEELHYRMVTNRDRRVGAEPGALGLDYEARRATTSG